MEALLDFCLQAPTYVTLPVIAVLLYWLYATIQSHRTIDITNKAVFITGCDTGFGHDLALKLDKKGAKVFAGCLTQQGARLLAAKASLNFVTIIVDVTKSDQITAAVKTVEAQLDGHVLWGVVNNAGVVGAGLIDWIPLDAFKKIMDVNLWGAVDVTKQFFPLLRASKGRVVNVSSITGRVMLPGVSSYAIPKHATEAFSDCLRIEASMFGGKLLSYRHILFQKQFTRIVLIDSRRVHY